MSGGLWIFLAQTAWVTERWPAVVGVLVIAAVLGAVFLQARSRTRERTRERLGLDEGGELESSSAWVEWADGLFGAVGLDGLAERYTTWMRRAGVFGHDSGTRFLAGMILLVATLVVAVLAAGIVFPELPLGWLLLSPVALGILLPNLWLIGRRRMYRRRLERDLPFWLDLHATLIESGMGFDEGLSRICEESDYLERPIFRELELVQRRIGLGETRSQALRGIAAEVDVEGLHAVVGALVQGDETGGGVTEALRSQAEMVRNKVWEESLERAHRLPVKLVFPIAAGVFPLLFLMLIGPSVLRMIEILENY